MCLLPPFGLIARPALTDAETERSFDADGVKAPVTPLFLRRVKSEDVIRRDFLGERAKERL